MQGCDGSVLLDDTATMIGEKQAEQNVNSLKGFDLVDKIKEKLEAECPGAVSPVQTCWPLQLAMRLSW